LSARGLSGATQLVTRTTTFVLRLVLPSRLVSWLNQVFVSALSQHSTITDPAQAASHFVEYFSQEFIRQHSSNNTTTDAEGSADVLVQESPASESQGNSNNGRRSDGVAMLPDFEVCGHYEALARARNQSRFLVCYLHAPEHQEAKRFCAETLSNPQVATFLSENFVVWGGSVTKSRDALRLAQALGVAKYPCLAVITSSSIIQNFGGLGALNTSNTAHTHTHARQQQQLNQTQQYLASASGMALIALSEGFLTPSNALELLSRVLDDHGPILVAAKAEQDERNFDRRIRQEQEEAYAEALEEDRRKERERREIEEEQERATKEQEQAEQRQREEEEKKELQKEAVVQRRRERSESVPEEPPLDQAEHVTKLMIRFPDGSRVQRRFFNEDKVRAVYLFVDSLETNTSLSYKLVSNFPRQVFDEGTLDKTLLQAGLSPQASLFLQSED
jgi:FAS-associated factor 2